MSEQVTPKRSLKQEGVDETTISSRSEVKTLAARKRTLASKSAPTEVKAKAAAAPCTSDSTAASAASVAATTKARAATTRTRTTATKADLTTATATTATAASPAMPASSSPSSPSVAIAGGFIAKASDESRIQELQMLIQRRAKLKMAIATLQAEHKAWTSFNTEAKLAALKITKQSSDITASQVKQELEATLAKPDPVPENLDPELSIKPKVELEMPTNPKAWHYTKCSFALDSSDNCDNFSEEHKLLSANLAKDGLVGELMAPALGAALYAACINHIPLLSIGPCANELCMALSATLQGGSLGNLLLGATFDPALGDHVRDAKECMVLVENLFGRGWSDSILPHLQSNPKYVVLSHPYVDDITLEPHGICNYVWPVLTECFIENMPRGGLVQGLRTTSFQSYERMGESKLELASYFKELKLSKFAFKRLDGVLYDLKQIYSFNEYEDLSSKDLELIFGLLPFALLNQKLDVVMKCLDETKDSLHEQSVALVQHYLP